MTQKKFELPVVSLPGVDDSYPPLKKSLMMIKYMHNYHIDEYEWFMRADDDLYVRNDKLEGLLRSLNSSDDIHLGQARTAAEGKGKLHLLPGDNYYVELGRCIQRYAGVPCTLSYEMRSLFFHNYTANKPILYGDLNTKAINDAITLHPLKEPAYMYRLHSHFMNKRIQDLQHEGVKLQRVLRTMDQLLQANPSNRLSLQKKLSLQDKRDFHHQLAVNNTEK
ncbi:Chondroitin sulfate synthase 1 [Desmophyllum pertusum]|uniref:Hexosyltransferase n=1 Tax=Desmophyllum pertusum TaxID=174260 RepID=A0A9X0CPV2_9CNID|nr:Chondroitin sulfate synthase 1 [Desmophyllum pertusum]